jgi:hypothetical protein
MKIGRKVIMMVLFCLRDNLTVSKFQFLINILKIVSFFGSYCTFYLYAGYFIWNGVKKYEILVKFTL